MSLNQIPCKFVPPNAKRQNICLPFHGPQPTCSISMKLVSIKYHRNTASGVPSYVSKHQYPYNQSRMNATLINKVYMCFVALS